MNPFTRALQNLRSKSYNVLFYNDPLETRARDRDWSREEYLDAHRISLYTNRAIEKRAEKLSEIDFYLTRRGDDDAITDHPILTLLNRPNEHHTGRQFWSLYQKYKDLIGSVYVWMEPGGPSFGTGKQLPKALHLLRPDRVSLRFEDGRISEYFYSAPGGEQHIYKPEEILYDFYPDPKWPLYGMSLLRAGIRAIDTEVQLSKYHSQILRNGGRVESVMKFKTPNLTKQQVEELHNQYEAQYAEARNSGKPLFLGGDADLVKLGLNPQELAYLESKRVILNDISIMTGVPSVVLSVTNGETYANAQAGIDIFLRETVKPLMTNLSSKLDWRLVPDGFDLDFVDPTPQNVEETRKNLETANTIGALTTNEKRSLLKELGINVDEVPEGDDILVQTTLQTLDSLKEPPEPNDPQDQPGAEDPEDGQDPEGTPGDAGDQEGPGSKSIRRKSAEHPLKDKGVRELYGNVMVRRLDRGEARLARAMQAYFVEQKRRVLEHLGAVRVYRRKDLVDEAFNNELELRLAAGTVLPIIRDVLAKAGQDATEMAGGTRPFVLSTEMQTWLDTRANLFAGQITDTTFNQLKDAFAQSLEAGEGRQKLIQRIRDVYAGYDEVRARTIARTEVHGATQQGTIYGYKQAGVATKIWVWAPGVKGGVRPKHEAIDGEEVPIDHHFSNGLMYPGDPSAGPEETVNCSCSI